MSDEPMPPAVEGVEALIEAVRALSTGLADRTPSLRDRFAMAALPALLSRNENLQQVILQAYQIADGCLSARMVLPMQSPPRAAEPPMPVPILTVEVNP
jgi:hypothetical protein